MDRYVPSPSSYGMPAVPRKGTVDAALPKYFDSPLTCFFWHQNGVCNKRGDLCSYAQWNTDNLASAPINIPGRTYTTQEPRL